MTAAGGERRREEEEEEQRGTATGRGRVVHPRPERCGRGGTVSSSPPAFLCLVPSVCSFTRLSAACGTSPWEASYCESTPGCFFSFLWFFFFRSAQFNLKLPGDFFSPLNTGLGEAGMC